MQIQYSNQFAKDYRLIKNEIIKSAGLRKQYVLLFLKTNYQKNLMNTN
jgi:mRNA-degrading endonuclease YafQ of YafQ-DinJ toxin-antitoxin module